MATNRITFKEFKKISEELKVYDNLKFINATLGKELITTTLEGKSKTMTLAEWRLITATIKDKVLYPYEIWIDEDQYTLMDAEKSKPMGFYTGIGNLINKIVKLNIASKKETYTLVGFLESYNNIKEELLNPFKNK